jgi:cyclophilin family peptidyl-prolyl cis-trans isomerase
MALALLAGAVASAGCGSEPPAATPAVPLAREPVPVPDARGPRPVVEMEVEGFGGVTIELFADIAPKTVENFLKLAEEDFYVGTTFHRVIPQFAIQGGDPLTKDRDPRNDGKGGPGYVVEDEYTPIAHRRGIVSMANKGHPKTAGSQFFVVVKDQPNLDGKYTVFGRVLEGMDVVDRISETPRDVYGRYGPPDRPREDVVIAGIQRISDGSAALAQREEPVGEGNR